MTYDIFISYKRRDTSSAIAALVYNYLSTKGYKVFFDRKEIRQGRFNEQLYNHIEAAKDIIILLEETSLRACFSEISDAYKTDWFCKEVMHALELEKDKHIIPILIGGYTMPEPDQLPEELKSLPLQNAISLDASEMDEVFQKYFINQGYLLSKPQGITPGSTSLLDAGEGISDFLFYTSSDCDIYECGEKMVSISSDNDEEHPYRYGVKRCGEHRFQCINNDTCEEIKIVETIESGGQKYIELKWTKTQNLWELTEENIEKEDDANILFDWGGGLFWGTSTHQPEMHLAYQCLCKAADLGSDDAKEFFISRYTALFDRELSTEEILPWLEKASDLGSTNAKVSIAKFLDGIDDERSVAICAEAADAGNVDAMYHLGFIYLFGEQGVSVNPKLAERWLLAAAKAGSVNAMCRIGAAYEYGDILSKDEVEAARFYQMAVDHGSKRALTMLGNCYRRGIGVEQDKEKAVELYKKAVESSGNIDEVDPWSEYIMGLCYKSGTGVEKDESKALEWFYRAARNGDGSADAMFQIGFYHFHGIATEQNYKQAYEWFVKASEKDDPDSHLFLGYMYNDGLYVEQNSATALDHFNIAASDGIADAMNEIGFIYYKGQGVERNLQTATEWFRGGAEEGHPTCQRMAALSYTDKNPNEEDLGIALNLFEQSANQNDAISLYILGDIFKGDWELFKEFVDNDNQKALMYYEKSAELGNSRAQFKAGRMNEYQDVPNFQPNYEKAMKYYQMAAENGYVPAYERIGRLYEYGNGVEKSEEKALEWRCKAIEKGDIGSYYWMMGYHNGNIPQQIIDSLNIAAKDGNSDAKRALAEMYLKGQAECEDKQIAISIYKDVAEEGDLNAQYKLALLYMQKHLPLHQYYVEHDLQKAIDLFNSILTSYEEKPYRDNGALPEIIVGSHYNLAFLYKKGKGLPKDEDKALEHFTKAATNGLRIAQAEILKIQRKRNASLSAFFIALSNEELFEFAFSEFKEACEEMSRRYREGDRKEKNNSKANYWMEKSKCNMGKPNLKQRLFKIFKKKDSLLNTDDPNRFNEPQKWFWQK